MKFCHFRGCRVVITVLTLLLVATSSFVVSFAIEVKSISSSSLILISRTVTQDQGAWVADYRLRNTVRTGIIATPEAFKLKVEGWVSNSRIASHAVPRWSSLLLAVGDDFVAFSNIINTVDESQRCRERMLIAIRSEKYWQPDNHSIVKNTYLSESSTLLPIAAGSVPIPPLSIGPGDILHLRLRLEHQHSLYGDYDPLLGIRTIELTLGKSVFEDILPLDREQYLAQPNCTWPEPPEEYRDRRHFLSPPDSLRIEAGARGHRSYRYPECPVRYNTKMKLQFSYLIAAGTEGECRLHIGQNKDTPLAWRQLHEASFEERLNTIGYWTKYEHIVHTEAEATRLILEFKITGDSSVGEMWIDNVSLAPWKTPAAKVLKSMIDCFTVHSDSNRWCKRGILRFARNYSS